MPQSLRCDDEYAPSCGTMNDCFCAARRYKTTAATLALCSDT